MVQTDRWEYFLVFTDSLQLTSISEDTMKHGAGALCTTAPFVTVSRMESHSLHKRLASILVNICMFEVCMVVLFREHVVSSQEAHDLRMRNGDRESTKDPGLWPLVKLALALWCAVNLLKNFDYGPPILQGISNSYLQNVVTQVIFWEELEDL